ncbi:MAG: zinc ABC transporter substrate-binding protein [bacterium]|nr:zinc ABC transporter substrate-binding protein [bacterium]
MNRSRLVILLAALAVLLLSISAASAQDEPLKIVATTTQAADLTTILAGDLVGEAVEITPLMGAGVDPHLYRPTESDIAAMNEADLVVYSGLNLEGQFGAVFEALGQRSVRIYAISDPVKDAGFTIGGFDLSEEFTDVDDPHFWFDPRNWQLSAEGLAEVLSETDPANADLYAANLEVYNEQLTLLYDWSLAAMSEVPEEQRVLVTSHDAFQYFGAAFEWQVRGLQGISTESEAGVADVQDLAAFIVENDIPVLFVESSVPPDAIEAVQEAVNAAGGDVGRGVRRLYSDAMGDPETFGGTYVGMIAENVITILQSFGVEIPEWPEDLIPVPPAELLEGEGA